MKKNNFNVNPKTRKGKEQKSRVFDLMEQIDPKKNNELETSNVELIKHGPNDKVYAIVRENKNYYIKRGDVKGYTKDSTPIITENRLGYIGGIPNKNQYRYPSYSKALKQMNIMFTNIFESKGEVNKVENPSVSDNVILESEEGSYEYGDEEEESDNQTILYDDEEEGEDNNMSETEKKLNHILKTGGESPKKQQNEGTEDLKNSFKLANIFENKETPSSFMRKIEEKLNMVENEDENNPWAICRAQQNKHGWSDEKTERCIKDVKAKNESTHRKKKVAEELGQEEEVDLSEEEDEEKDSVDYKENSRYVLRTNDPDSDEVDAPEYYGMGGEEESSSAEGGELDGDELGGDEKENPFDDEPFDPGVDADEEENPSKFIQQLTGKLSQSIRNYTKEEGQVDSDLEQYVINMILDATSPEELSDEEQQEMISKIKGGGEEDTETKDDEPSGDEEEMSSGEEGEESGEEETPKDEDEESIEDELEN